MEKSAGLLVFRMHNNKYQVLLVHPANMTRPSYGIPKGHIMAGESKLLAAMRETFEETGCRAKPIVKLPPITYKVSAKNEEKHDKQVTFYLALYESGVNEKGVAKNHDDENDDVRFFDIDDLPQIFYAQHSVIKSAVQYLKK